MSKVMPIRPDPQNYSICLWWPSTTSQMRGGRFVGPCVSGGLLVHGSGGSDITTIIGNMFSNPSVGWVVVYWVYK